MRLFATLVWMIVQPALAQPFLVAHRGASAEAPENTLPAFELAWEQGADAIEADFHLTKDKHIVCIHDDDTGRVARKKLVVAESTLAELRALDVGIKKGAEWKDTRIPTFDEVVVTVPTHGEFFIEIKSGPKIIPHLLKAIDSSSLPLERIRIISFTPDIISEVERTKPEVRTSLLCKFRTQLGVTRPTKKQVIKKLLKSNADALSTNAWKGINTEFLKNISSHGKEHQVWTVNDSKIALRFISLGSSAITTDRPGPLRQEIVNARNRE